MVLANNIHDLKIDRFTPLGAHASAGMFGFVETAKANNLDPFHFMYRLSQKLPYENVRQWNILSFS